MSSPCSRATLEVKAIFNLITEAVSRLSLGTAFFYLLERRKEMEQSGSNSLASNDYLYLYAIFAYREQLIITIA